MKIRASRLIAVSVALAVLGGGAAAAVASQSDGADPGRSTQYSRVWPSTCGGDEHSPESPPTTGSRSAASTASTVRSQQWSQTFERGRHQSMDNHTMSLCQGRYDGHTGFRSSYTAARHLVMGADSHPSWGINHRRSSHHGDHVREPQGDHHGDHRHGRCDR